MESESLQVVVGVIKNEAGKILIARRDKSLHQGGLWEFPGGKIESGETDEYALSRELKEELDIDMIKATPLITVNHRYPDLAVTLRVYGVEQFSGTARSCLGQPIRWVDRQNLAEFTFPAANRPIVTAALLPPYYAILDDKCSRNLLDDLQKLLDKGIRLIQARLKNTSPTGVERFLAKACPLCRNRTAILLINSSAECDTSKVNGIHLTSSHLLSLQKRPANFQWVAASCHNRYELECAEKIGVDFAVLAPVLPTQTHPDAKNLGWSEFAALTAQINIPVYALGGLNLDDLDKARQNGAQGIAAIRAFLD